MDALRESRRPLRVIDLARRLKMSASAVSRIVSTLSAGGLIEYDGDTDRLYLGFGLVPLASASMARRELDRIAIPIIAEITARFTKINRYVSLGRLYRGQIVYLRGLAKQLPQRDINIITMAPMHATAPGKVFAAYMPFDDVRQVLEATGMDPYTPRTITTLEGFKEAVERVRRSGFGFDDGEVLENFRHIATPIFDHNGKVVATLSVGGLAEEMQGEELDAVARAVWHGSFEISRQIGYDGIFKAGILPSEELALVSHAA